MKAVILAGGLGTRLKPFTEVIPKPLLPVGEKAILQIQIEHLRAHGFDEIYLATNYKSEYISNFFGKGELLGVRLTISKENEPLGTAGPLGLLREELTEPFLVMNGDILTQADYTLLFEAAMRSTSILTLGIRKEVFPFRFGNISFSGDYVTGIEEKPDLITWILAGIYVMKPEILDHIPPGRTYGMDQLIRDLLMKQVPVAKYEIREYWIDIGKVDDYEQAQKDYRIYFGQGAPGREEYSSDQ